MVKRQELKDTAEKNFVIDERREMTDLIYDILEFLLPH